MPSTVVNAEMSVQYLEQNLNALPNASVLLL